MLVDLEEELRNVTGYDIGVAVGLVVEMVEVILSQYLLCDHIVLATSNI